MFTAEKKHPLSTVLKTNPDTCTVSPRTGMRWHSHGVRGVKLECVRVGVRLMTSHEALVRFLAHLNSGTAAAPDATPAPRSPTQRGKASAAAAAELQAAGC